MPSSIVLQAALVILSRIFLLESVVGVGLRRHNAELASNLQKACQEVGKCTDCLEKKDCAWNDRSGCVLHSANNVGKGWIKGKEDKPKCGALAQHPGANRFFISIKTAFPQC